MSITEAEYMAAAEVTKDALWLTSLVRELGVWQVLSRKNTHVCQDVIVMHEQGRIHIGAMFS
ncbi:hypothetical protein MTR_8g080650 [Medicago truncatula]|uniref:RNA-directed DNA polymerase n=1 Tax=Medicago truncatula TaxID=3880 RepID=A0A072TTT1_MEDTR|nr:hypothetical protein MTR_8g080650 [Medicago truncatula]